MLTVSQVARQFGLSRSALLYYHRIGLLRPSGRSGTNYRLYSRSDVERLELICLYRQAGLSLVDIARVLASGPRTLARQLELRLRALNRDIQQLRQQQQLIIRLLQSEDARRQSRHLDQQGWIAILRSSGMSADDMRRWHAEFERLAPEAHQDFLEQLGLAAREIDGIRGRARALLTRGAGTAAAGRAGSPADL